MSDNELLFANTHRFGSPHNVKARWVARGFTQIPGEDYFETYAPVIDATSLRLFLMIMVTYQLIMHRSDVPAAFLNGGMEAEAELYTIQMLGFETGKSKRSKVKRGWYGTKQGGRVWNVRLDKELVDVLKLKRLVNDRCIYMCGSLSDVSTLVIIGVYVDDLIDAWHPSAKAVAEPIIQHLVEVFKLKRKDKTGRFVGLVLDWQKDGSLLINQSGQILEMLDRFGMADAAPSREPMQSIPTKRGVDEERCDEPFRSFVGSAMYIATHSRPDISFAVGALSRQMSDPAMRHWKDVKLVLRYLRGTADLNLKYVKGSKKIAVRCYTDSDWGGCQETGVSTSGYCLFMNNCLVDWRSSKQQSVASSTAHAELDAGQSGASKLIWTINLLREMGAELDLPASWFVDNQTALRVSLEDRGVKKLKHEMLKIHFLREQVNKQLIAPTYVPTKDQVADGFTKPLVGAGYKVFVTELGLISGAG